MPLNHHRRRAQNNTTWWKEKKSSSQTFSSLIQQSFPPQQSPKLLFGYSDMFFLIFLVFPQSFSMCKLKILLKTDAWKHSEGQLLSWFTWRRHSLSILLEDVQCCTLFCTKSVRNSFSKQWKESLTEKFKPRWLHHPDPKLQLRLISTFSFKPGLNS